VPLNHTPVTESTLVSRRFRALSNNLVQALDHLEFLRGVCDNANDAVNFSAIETLLGLPSNGQTNTNSNGYKALARITALHEAFKSNVEPAAAADAASKMKDKLDALTLYYA
jgi:hypothetical protein